MWPNAPGSGRESPCYARMGGKGVMVWISGDSENKGNQRVPDGEGVAAMLSQVKSAIKNNFHFKSE